VASVVEALYGYATTTLRLPPIDAERAGRYEATDLVDEMFERGLEHDAEASALLGQLGDDKPRADIAAALGWTVQRVKVVRNRIARTLAARARQWPRP
jgi:hypothetical protein